MDKQLRHGAADRQRPVATGLGFHQGPRDYRRLLREFRKGETRYYDQAQPDQEHYRKLPGHQRYKIFLPDSELQFMLSTRNLKRVNFALYKVDLTRDVRFRKNIEEEDGETDETTVDSECPLRGVKSLRAGLRLQDQGNTSA